MFAGKHLDHVLGFDIHIVQPPGTVPPTPSPHPYMGMIMSVADYLPLIGQTLMIHKLRAAQPMTNIIDIPPHFPLVGTFIKLPVSRGEVFLGSATVGRQSLAGSLVQLAGGPQTILTTHPLSRMMSVTLGCADVGVPPSTNPGKKEGLVGTLGSPNGMLMAVPLGPPVLVSGPPGPAPLDAWAIRLAIMKLMARLGPKLSDALQGLAEKARNALRTAGPNFLRNLADNENFWRKVASTICNWTGHPVDIVTGKVFTDSEDFNIPGPIPLAWQRIWHSSSDYKGPLGYGWHHNYDLSLVPKIIDENAVLRHRMADGRIVYFPQLEIGERYYDRLNRLDLMREEEGYILRDAKNLFYRFHEQMEKEWKLSRIENSVGFNIEFAYDQWDVLSEITDSMGRIFKIESNAAGQILNISAPDPIVADKYFTILEFEYSVEGDLVAVRDALKNPFSYQYEKHLLVKETNRNGLNFYFKYEGEGTDARCVHTYGDGDLLNHKLTYLEDHTIVERIVRSPNKAVESFVSYYYHNGALVTKEIDPLGNETNREYNQYFELISETNALEEQTQYDYDDRGNKVATYFPDETQIQLRFDANDNLVQATDQLSGDWTWEYDEKNRLVRSIDSMQRSSKYLYNSANRLSVIVNPVGDKTLFGYDSWGNLEQITTTDNATNRWEYDRLGRRTCFRDPKGNITSWKYDLLNQIVTENLPDGNQRKITYDPEGNIIRAKDHQSDVQYEYQGMWKLKARIENDTRVVFRYNSEEDLVAIVNEHGSVYQFDLDANGKVEIESGFDEVKRYYKRDALGRVALVMRATGIESKYQYDKQGRVTKVTHSNGEVESYQYREDGNLIFAENSNSQVYFERDIRGRLIKETINGIAVHSTFDPLGRRKSVRSDLGLQLDIERNRMGDVMGVLAQHADHLWEVNFKRDIMGMELERELPGEVKARWERDHIGRPIKHEITGGGGRKYRSRTYVWDVNNRIKKFIDFEQNVTRFEHDPVGNLTMTEYPDGKKEYRMPDEIGNLFKTKDQRDRKYGRAGQLLEADGTKYKYDEEGNLIKKMTSTGKVWHYRWNATGVLQEVIRPDQKSVTFTYDPLARRLTKHFDGTTTHWIWDGNIPLHEWETQGEKVVDHFSQKEDSPEANEIVFIEIKEKETSPTKETIDLSDITFEEATKQNPIAVPEPLSHFTTAIPAAHTLVTWVFEPDTFTPVAKLTKDRKYSIQTDHLGTPISMYDELGERVWAVEMNTYGQLKVTTGHKMDCPFRYPGQYEDEETGLYYNRFRYYDFEVGVYIKQDPIRLDGGFNIYRYVPDTITWFDIFGLTYVRFKRWKRGEPIDKPLPNGSAPSWDVVRSRYWKNRAHYSKGTGEFDQFNLDRMNKGLAPQDYNPRTGQMESRELHHVVPQRQAGNNDPLNIVELTPDQHATVDPFRHRDGVQTTSGITLEPH